MNDRQLGSCIVASILCFVIATGGCSTRSSEVSSLPEAGIENTEPSEPSQEVPPKGSDGGAPAECAKPCAENEVCSNGSCVALPESCPCPAESYCDLATNRCKAGCTADDHCSAGRYCDTDARQCKTGCREDACGTNETCDLTTRTCACTTDFHECGGACVREGLSSCGPSCETCATDAHGTASCNGTSCRLTCNNGYRNCGGACAACPAGASSYTCAGNSCVASGCAAGSHVCTGTCVPENVTSCGTTCSACSDPTQGGCSGGSCYGLRQFPDVPAGTTCAAKCASEGRTCAATCNIRYQRPTSSGTVYNEIAGGHYTQHAAFQPWGYVDCTTGVPGDAPTSLRCCCTE